MVLLLVELNGQYGTYLISFKKAYALKDILMILEQLVAVVLFCWCNRVLGSVDM